MLKNLLVSMFRRNILWVEIRQSAVARSVGTFGAPTIFFTMRSAGTPTHKIKFIVYLSAVPAG
jgi:hypothetical protein